MSRCPVCNKLFCSTGINLVRYIVKGRWMGKYLKVLKKHLYGSMDKSAKRPSEVVQFLILLLTIAAVLITVFLANRSYNQHRHTALVQFNEQQRILAHSAAAGIETIFNEVRVALIATARIPSVQQMEPACLGYMRNLYQGFLPKTSIRRLDEHGVLRFIYPSKGWRGNIVGRNYGSEKFFQDAKASGDVTVSSIVLNENGTQRIRVVTPVYQTAAGTNIFKGLLVVSYDIGVISDAFISPITSGKTGYAWLINQEGIFLTHFEKDFIGQDIFSVRMHKSPTLPLDSIHAIQKQMLVGHEGTGRYISGWHRGKTGTIEKLIAYSPVHIGNKIWSVAVVAPVNEVDEIIRDAGLQTMYSFGFVVFTLLIGGSILFAMSYRWSSSLEREVKTRTNKLRETTEYLNNLIQCANAPIIAWDHERRVTIINRAFEEMSGRTEAEMLGHPIDLFFPPENLQDALEKLIHDMPEKNRRPAEIPILKTDGTVRLGEWSSSNVYANDGLTLIATVAHGADVTERKQAEEALHRSEERFRRAVENMPFDFFLLDKSGRYAMQNSFCRQGWGNLIGKLPSEMAPSREIAALWDDNNRRAFSGDTVREEVEYIINGKKKHIFNIIAPIAEEDVVEGIIGINIDVTERKEAEESLRLISSAVEQTTEGLAITDLEGTLIFLNNAFAAMHGLAQQDCLGQHLSMFHSGDQMRAFEAAITELIQDELFKGEIWHTRKDGSIFPSLMHNSILYDEQGSRIGLIFVMRDITEQKSAEKALRKSEAQYKAVVETQTELICRYTPDWTLTFVNDAYCRYFEDTRENLIGSNFMSFVPDESHKGIEEIHCMLLTLDVQEVTHEHQIVNGKGELRWQQWVYHAIFDHHHQLVEYQSVGRDITELKHAEEALQRSEERYRSLFEGAPDAVFIADSESGCIIDANPAAWDLMGKSRNELIGLHFMELHPLSMREYEEKKFIAHCDRGSGMVHESLILHADGTEIPVEIVAQEITIGGKNLAQGIFRNITERKRAEEALQNIMQNLAMSQEMAQLGSWEWDITTDEVHWSDETYRLFGWQPHEIDVNLTSYTKQVHPDDRGSMIDALQNSLAGAGPCESEHRIIRRDGKERLHHTYGEVKYDTLGNPTKLVGIVQDITERRQAEETLRLTKFSVDRASDSIFWITPAGRFVYVNEAASDNLGYTQNELLEMNVFDVDSSFSLDARETIWNRLKNNRVIRFESTHMTKDGRVFPVEITSNYMKFHDQEYEFAFARDIAERKHAEEEKKQLESQLHHAQKMETLGTLVAGVAHEINNPINKIIFDIPLLQKIWRDVQTILRELEVLAPGKKYGGLSYDFLKKHLPQLLSDMDMAANRVAKTVSNLKDFTRQSSIADRAPMQVNTAVENAVRIIETTARKSGIELVLALPPELPPISGNLQSIEQAIINIIINAIQAIDHDHGQVHVVTGIDTHERYVFINVSDNGPGIDPSIAEKIFDPFITSRHNEGGTGLGLSITRNLVEAHGGKVTYKSSQETGTTFTLLLPFAEHTI